MRFASNHKAIVGANKKAFARATESDSDGGLLINARKRAPALYSAQAETWLRAASNADGPAINNCNDTQVMATRHV